MPHEASISGYRYAGEALNPSHDYLLPALKDLIRERHLAEGGSIFDLGCGNGAVANEIAALGYKVVGVDPSDEGIEIATRAYPHLKLEQGSAYDDLSSRFGRFPIVYSLEVVEHVYDPRLFARGVYDLVAPGGIAVISTPYHGYLKNVALALSGKMDAHFTALWDHGHIKFWSIATLRELLLEGGFELVDFMRVGRVPALAKSMIAVARKAPIALNQAVSSA